MKFLLIINIMSSLRKMQDATNSVLWNQLSWVLKLKKLILRAFFGREKKQLQLFGAKNDCFFFGGTSKDKIDDRDEFILKRMKVSYDRYETLLHVVLL